MFVLSTLSFDACYADTPHPIKTGRVTPANSQQGFKRDVSSQKPLAVIFNARGFPPTLSHTHPEHLVFPFYFVYYCCQKQWRFTGGCPGYAHPFSPLPPILWFLLIPCLSALLTLLWTRLALNYSQLVNTIRVLCSRCYLDAVCCYYKR